VDAATGVITTVAGTGEPGYAGDGGPAAKAQLREPNGLALDGRGALYLADVSDNRIRKVDLASGRITTVVGTGRREFSGDGGPAAAAAINGARAVAVGPRGDLFICEREGNRIRQVDAAGIIRTVAGTGAAGYSGDGGPALQATFRGPKWVDVDPQGAIYVVDTENHCVRRIDPVTQRITTVVGSGKPGPGGDGGPPTSAQLDRPHGSTTRGGQLYVADTNNHRIRVCPAQ
jgi:sugar lactone lactonase YvrE